MAAPDKTRRGAICEATGKLRYRTWMTANHILEQRVLDAIRNPRKVARQHERRVYQCPHCGGWHLTSRAR